MEVVFDRPDDVEAMIVENHYSHRVYKRMSTVVAALALVDNTPVAALTISRPSTRWAHPVHELTRLVRTEHGSQNLVGLISESCKEARKQGVDLLVSYADYTQGHHGGVYQAASWNYHGMRKPRVDGFNINGVFVPNRSVSHKYGTQSVPKLRDMGLTVEKHYDLGKWLYWKPLSKTGKSNAQLLGFQTNPYPKPSRSE